MKNKLPWLLLMLSVLFNVFFIIGHFRKDKSCKKRRTPQGRVEQLAKELDLDKKQQEEILALFIKESDRFNVVMEVIYRFSFDVCIRKSTSQSIVLQIITMITTMITTKLLHHA